MQSRAAGDLPPVRRATVDAGKAYYAFETAEELEALRNAAEAAKLAFRYARPATLPTEADADAARAAAGRWSCGSSAPATT